MMSSLVTVFAVVYLAFGAVVGTSSTDCPTPTSPENGEFIFYQGGMTVKYSCNPGYRLVGKAFVSCENGEWNSEAPQCLQDNADATALPSNKDGEFKQRNPRIRLPFTWKTHEDTATVKSDSDVLPLDPEETVVSKPPAGVSLDMDGVQSDEAARQMYEYISAYNYYYPRQAVVDPYYAASPYMLSDNQIHWINSLQPEVRDQYLKDVYNIDSRQAHASLRAQQLMRSYDDAYRYYYGSPYYYYYHHYYTPY